MSASTEACKAAAKDASDDEYVNTSVVELGPILEAESKYGPIFRRELFDVAYAAHLSIQNKRQKTSDLLGGEQEGEENIVSDDQVVLLDIYGNERKVYLMGDGVRVEHNGIPYITQRCWSYRSIQSLGYAYGGGGGGNRDQLCPYDLGSARHVEADAKDCFKVEVLTENSIAWKGEWTNSEMYHRITAFLDEHAGKTMQHVDKIICFGLGCFDAKYPLAVKCRYIQHLAAYTIRDVIAQKQGGEPPKIYTQEPHYCKAAIALVKARFDMEVLEDPEGFRALDGNTFVMTVSPDVPVRQVAFGLTHEFGGPAGMFCNSITSEGLECDGKGSEARDGHHSVSPYRTCEPSPGLWRYKQESVWMEYSDMASFGDIGVYLKRRA
ncbi:hypothetical protein N0V83_003588 [Neocucurbitaria cava]|uniref:SRR1-like domain-containing protein n=1 Tax=Neocucurbitaria cava TaxID=798079 RepID=A0A9W8YCK9_9PLEO|nr:hypothetical protein N0V83_003588 [Neocucurbitaria cava]